MSKKRLIELARQIERAGRVDGYGADTQVSRWVPEAREALGRVEPKGLRFGMRYYVAETECGTAGCIAGHALKLFGAEGAVAGEEAGSRYVGDEASLYVGSAAAILLGLSEGDSRYLFEPWEAMAVDEDEITPGQAAAVLRLVADGRDPREAWREVLKRR